jgi:hypothetical protein
VLADADGAQAWAGPAEERRDRPWVLDEHAPVCARERRDVRVPILRWRRRLEAV